MSGGAVTKARRVNGREDLREMYIQPETTGDISIQLPATMSCSATGAICTKDDRLPSNSDSDTVKEPTTISVADATVEEAARAELSFGVTQRPLRDQRRDGDSRCRVHVDRRNAHVLGRQPDEDGHRPRARRRPRRRRGVVGLDLLRSCRPRARANGFAG